MATRRTARICIRNGTSRLLKAVGLRHRGSDGARHVAQWSDLASGMTTSACQVEYETGLVPTAGDWWLVTWVYADGQEIFVTDPRNVVEAIDATQARLVAVMPDFASSFSAALTGAKAEEVLDAIADGVVTHAGPSGWHPHALGKAEADRTMTIEIRPDHDVVFTSRSRESVSPSASTTVKAAG